LTVTLTSPPPDPDAITSTGALGADTTVPPVTLTV
jgi:hypothetical protein